MSVTLLDFYSRNKQAELKPRSQVDYEIQLRHMQRYFDGWLVDHGQTSRPVCLDDLSVEHVHGLMNWQLRGDRSRGTADKARRVVVSLWNLAADQEKATRPPKIKALHGRKHEPTAWSVEEFERILDGAGRLPGPSRVESVVGPYPMSEWFQLSLLLVYNSGVRVDTLMQVEWTWIDLDGRVMRVPPEAQKDDEGQTVTLLPRVVDALRSSQALATCDRVFGDWPNDGGVTQWPALTHRLRWAIVLGGLRGSIAGLSQTELQVKLREVSDRDLWHKLRRTFATEMYRVSGDIELVRELLGHSSIAVTRRYIDKSKIGRRLQAETLVDPCPNRLRLFDPGDAGIA